MRREDYQIFKPRRQTAEVGSEPNRRGGAMSEV
jgi:hypothetical protein